MMPPRDHEDVLPGNSFVHWLADRVARWTKPLQQAGADVNELECLPAYEVDRIAREFNLNDNELRLLASKDSDAANEVDELLEAVGIDPRTLDNKEPLVMRDLQRLCTRCKSKDQCRLELDSCSASDNYRDFCPNAYTISALIREKSS